MTVKGISSKYLAMADLEVMPVRESRFMGLTDSRCASLRAFQRYSRDSTTDILDLSGRSRWITQKQSRVYAILRRSAGSSQRMTMTAIAAEAMICVSSVSRAITKFEAWGIFAVDVYRGRNGGISVRLRTVTDNLRHYAARAWDKIRARLNVAFTLPRLSDTGLVRTTTPMDATFTEDGGEFDRAWAEAEDRGRLLVAAIRADTPAPLPRNAGAFDPGNLTADNVIRERYEMDRDDPDWDLQLDYVRASYGLTA